MLHKNALTKVDWNFAQLLRHLTGCKFANRTSVSLRNQTIMPVHTTDYHPCTHCTDYCTVYLAGLIYMPPSAVCGIARNGRSHSSYRAKKKRFGKIRFLPIDRLKKTSFSLNWSAWKYYRKGLKAHHAAGCIDFSTVLTF